MSDDQTFTKEEVEQQVKAAAEAAAGDAVERFRAQQQYGPSSAAGGGTPARSAPRGGSYEEAEALVLGRLQKGDGLGDASGRIAQSKWQAGRIREAFEAAIYHPSYRSFSRTSPDDRKIQDDRKASRGRGGV